MLSLPLLPPFISVFSGLFGGEAVSETGMGGRGSGGWGVFITSCVSLFKDLKAKSGGGGREIKGTAD